MRFYPVVAKSDRRRIVAAVTGEDGARMAATLATYINRHAGDAVVKVGDAFDSDTAGVLYVGERAIPVNPSYGVKRDPNRVMLSALVADATAPRATRAAKATAKTTGTGNADTGAVAKPRTRAAKAKTTGAGPVATAGATRTRAKAGANA
jgi:hypothetical protein